MSNTPNNKTPEGKRRAAQAFLRGESMKKPLVDTITKAAGIQMQAKKHVPLRAEIPEERRVNAIVALEGSERNEKREDARRKKEAAERLKKEQEIARIKAEKDAEIRRKEAEIQKEKDEIRKAQEREENIKNAETRRLKSIEERKQKAAALVTRIQKKRGKPIEPPKNNAPGIKRVSFGKEPVKDRKIAPLRTFTDDVTRVVKDKKQTLIKVRIAEKKRAEEQEKKKPLPKKQSSGKGKGIFVVFIILILLGGGGYAYLTQTGGVFPTLGGDSVDKEPVPVQLPLASAIVRPDSETNINTEATQASILNNIAEAISSPVPNTIEHIYFTAPITVETGDGVERTQERANIHDVLAVWNQNMPNQLQRSLGGEFMLGAYFSETGTTSPFLIMTPLSFELTFTGMLDWEATLQNDLERLFSMRFFEAPQNPTTLYRDMFVEGYNTRILQDDVGNIGLLYSFIDEKFIVITTSEESFVEILSRLGV